MPDELKPKLDDFTAKVVSDPAKPQETLLLQGFLGASSQPDHTRVYSDLTLDSYVDVANADIIHVESLPKEQSPLGGSYLWVKKETEVVPGTGASEVSAKAKFLQGPIASEATQFSGTATQTAFVKTIPIVACHPTILVRACTNTSLPRCLVQTPACPTRPVVCDIVASGTGACTIPDPTINEGTWQFAPGQQQFGAAAQFAAPAAAQAQFFQTPQHRIPSVPCPTIACHTLAVSVCHICPPFTIHGPECPVQTTFCPQEPASLACGEQITVVGGFAAHAQQQQQQPAPMPAATAVAVCRVTEANCPTVAPAALHRDSGNSSMPATPHAALPHATAPLPLAVMPHAVASLPVGEQLPLPADNACGRLSSTDAKYSTLPDAEQHLSATDQPAVSVRDRYLSNQFAALLRMKR